MSKGQAGGWVLGIQGHGAFPQEARSPLVEAGGRQTVVGMCGKGQTTRLERMPELSFAGGKNSQVAEQSG